MPTLYRGLAHEVMSNTWCELAYQVASPQNCMLEQHPRRAGPGIERPIILPLGSGGRY